MKSTAAEYAAFIIQPFAHGVILEKILPTTSVIAVEQSSDTKIHHLSPVIRKGSCGLPQAHPGVSQSIARRTGILKIS